MTITKCNHSYDVFSAQVSIIDLRLELEAM